jgi:RNA polymerase sigma factor (sigma-70 family)
MTASDDDLRLAWAGGDQRSGAVLVQRYYARVDRFFRFKVGDERCVDLTQATFLAVQEGLSRFRGESSLCTWLFGIARNKLLHHLRDHGRDRQRFDPDHDSVADLDPSPATFVEVEQRQRLLLAALRRLTLDDQMMLELHYWERMSIAEIAEVVNRPINTVKTRMRRGRQRLEELMNELAESQEELESTRSGLGGWAERIRHECADVEGA